MNESIQVRGYKPWYKSRTIWTAIAIVGFGILETFGYPVPNQVYTSLVAMALYSLRRADSNIS
jgi:hypothetical protein